MSKIFSVLIYLQLSCLILSILDFTQEKLDKLFHSEKVQGTFQILTYQYLQCYKILTITVSSVILKSMKRNMRFNNFAAADNQLR